MKTLRTLLRSPLIEDFAIHSVLDYSDNDVSAFKQFASLRDGLSLCFLLVHWQRLNWDSDNRDNFLCGVCRCEQAHRQDSEGDKVLVVRETRYREREEEVANGEAQGNVQRRPAKIHAVGVERFHETEKNCGNA